MADPLNLESAKQVTITPTNSPGPQGADPHDLMIQYSADGETGWTELQPDDEIMYFRISTDGGYTWSEAIFYGTTKLAYEYMIKAKEWADTPENIEVEDGKFSALHWAAKAKNSGQSWAGKAQQWAENPEDVEVESGKFSALHWAAKAGISENNAESAATDAAQSATEAFGAAAPAWDSGAIYNYPDVVAFTNGHTYRCIGTNVTSAPNVDGIDNETDWTRITVSVDGFFEVDTNDDLMPMIAPLNSGYWILDTNGDIMPQEVA